VGISPTFLPNDSYIAATNNPDFRRSLHTKHTIVDKNYNNVPYYQVFEQKYGFIPNLSIFDLLFNMGNESVLILKKSFAP
jgi:hypothetical protein